MKSKLLAYILWVVGIFGWLGLHRFYLGKYVSGVVWIFTIGLFGIGSLVDLFILSGQVDQYNTKVRLEEIVNNGGMKTFK
jgi:TM2 domain-containing membrane protein YozV